MRLGQGLIPMAVVPVQGGCKQVCHCGSGGKGKTESGRVDVNPVAPGSWAGRGPNNSWIRLSSLISSCSENRWSLPLPSAFFWHQGRLFPTCAGSVFSVMAPRTLSVFCFSILWQTVCARQGEIRQSLQLPFRSVHGGKRIKEDILVPSVDTPWWTVAHIDFLCQHLHL